MKHPVNSAKQKGLPKGEKPFGGVQGQRPCRESPERAAPSLAGSGAAPQRGPRILFFSGGTALRELSRELVRYTHNSVHLVTPFDSGGSSAKLREAFGMPAVGDLRNRLMALADRTAHPRVYDLFAYRLPKDLGAVELLERLCAMREGRDPLVAAVPEGMRRIICEHLGFFWEAMRGTDFDLRGASVGNLVLAGGFLRAGREIDPVLELFSGLVKARGVVWPVSTKDLTLVAELEDGTLLAGQHLVTGKECGPIRQPVRRVYLSRSQRDTREATVEAQGRVRELIGSADLICYPMGSFYSSVVANVLVKGVGDAIARAKCGKVFVPNPAGDPEQLGMSLGESVRVLLEYLRASCVTPRPVEALLDAVLVDRRCPYPQPLGLDEVEALGVKVIETDLGYAQNDASFDGRALARVLVSMGDGGL